MSFIKSLGRLNIQTRSIYSRRDLNPKKFVSILKDVPPKPSCAWQLYFSDNLSGYKDSAGKIEMSSAAKELAVKWKSLDPSKKKFYQDKYIELRKAHDESLENALNNATVLDFTKENALRKKYNLTLLKDPKKPKRPKNSFLLYLEDLRKNDDPIIKGLATKEQASVAAKAYKELSDDKKMVYNKQSEKAFEQYRALNDNYLKASQ